MSMRQLMGWADLIGGSLLVLLVASSLRAETLPVAAPPAKYRLGLQLMLVPKALEEQLQVQGVLVNAVDKDSPAEKAGLKQYDIVTAAGEKALIKIADLNDALKASDGKELVLKVVRAGKPLEVTIMPQKVEEETENVLIKTRFPQLEQVEIELREIEDKIKEKLRDAGVDIRLQLIKPGKMMPQGLSWGVKREGLPENVEVNIHKKGQEPATIEVKKDGQEWKVKETELDKLPDDVRPHVEAMLVRPQRVVMQARELGPGLTLTLPEGFAVPAVPPAPAVAPVAPHSAKSTRDLEKQLEEMSRDMNKMRENLEDLRRTLRDRSTVVK